MARNNNQNTQVATRPQQTAVDATSNSRRAILERFQAGLERQMPLVRPMLVKARMGEEQFRGMVVLAIANSKDGKLFECSPSSLLKACAEAAQDGLSLAPQHKQADIIPRWNGKLKLLEAVYQPRYGGLMVLARRSGEIRKIHAEVVREKDEFDYELGMNKAIHIHKPAKGDRGPLINSYCIWVLKDGTKDFEVLDANDITRAKKASQSKDKDTGEFYGPWKDDEAEMWRKTAIRRAAKFMPSSAEDFQHAVARDMYNDIGEPMPGDDIVFDLPDDGAGAGAAVQPAADKQLDRLEQKVKQPAQSAAETKTTEAKAPEPKAPDKKAEAKAEPAKPANDGIVIVPLPKDGNKVDYAAWTAACVTAFDALSDDDAKKAWTVKHAVWLEGLEMSAPDVGDPILSRASSYR